MKGKNEDLFAKLVQYYDLDSDADFWFHKPSGKWILAHSAVQKIIKQPTKDGHTIQVPLEYKVIKAGIREEGGIHGTEVVLAGAFRLVDKEGKTVHKCSKMGEANEKNCTLPYSWAMAEKRMIDRGVLDLLSFAEIGVYSSVEAEDFDRSPNRSRGTGTALPQHTAAPTAPPSVSYSTEGGAPSPPSPPSLPSRLLAGEAEDIILESLADGGLMAPRQIKEATGLTTSQFNRAIKSLRDSSKIEQEGNRSSVRYRIPGGDGEPVQEAPPLPAPPVPQPPVSIVPPIPEAAPAPEPQAAPEPEPAMEEDPVVSEEEFSGVFNSIIASGVSIMAVLEQITQLTGCSTMPEAFASGKVTRSVVDKLQSSSEAA